MPGMASASKAQTAAAVSSWCAMRSGFVNLAPAGYPIALTTPEENRKLLRRQLACFSWLGLSVRASSNRGQLIYRISVRLHEQATGQRLNRKTETATARHQVGGLHVC